MGSQEKSKEPLSKEEVEEIQLKATLSGSFLKLFFRSFENQKYYYNSYRIWYY